MMDNGRFVCPQCATLYAHKGSEAAAPCCPRCGATPTAASQKRSRPKVVVRGSYKCRTCGHSFQNDSSTEDKPGCPACRSTNCEATSPTVRVYTGSDQKTERELKTDRFLYASWNGIRTLKSQCSAVLATASGMNITGQTLTELSRVLDKVKREAADARNQKRSALIEG